MRPAGAGLSPPQVRMRPNETSDVAVVITNVRGLTQVDVVLSYDPSVVEAADVRAGTVAGNLIEVITAWRAEDQGRSTVSDLVDLLEAAAAGTTRCP